ncbi:MAG: sn-glycerol-3-phosphate ABC transporter ATP-binding protein UgpC, partial [Rhodanobacteraceae bacterium]
DGAAAGDLQRLRPELARCIDKEIVLGLRPEHLHVVDAAPACEPDLRAQLEVVEPVGNEAFLNLRFGSNELVARVPPQTLPAHGAQVSLSFDPRNLHAFDPQSTRRIAHVD